MAAVGDLASQWTLSPVEARIIDEYRKLERRANEFRLEVLGGMAHGTRTVGIRPTPFLKVEDPGAVSLALDS